MTPEPLTKTRSRSRSRSRTRRISACYRHPSEPVNGFCALCLRERLAGLDPSGHLEPSSSTSISSFVSSVNDCGGAGITRPLEFRRSKSVSVGRCEASSCEPRRKSCDVRTKNTLSHLFNIDDESKGSIPEVKVESKSLEFSRIRGKELREESVNGEEGRVSEHVLVTNIDVDGEMEGDLKTMKEHIDLEWESSKHKVRDFKDIAGSFMVAASVFSKKLQKWRQKQKNKKLSSRSVDAADNTCHKDLFSVQVNEGIVRESQSEVAEYGFGRRSCDTEPRFSIDANRMSVDNSRFSFDEPRASWDGYLVARTIPRLAPMLSVVEDMILNRSGEQMHPIKEDELTSGLSAQSNSDSSSSQRLSSFNRSNSIRSSYTETLGSEVDDGKLILNAKVSPANADIFQGTKLVITEKELKDWHLNSLKDDHSKSLHLVSKDATADAPIGFKKLTRWHRVGIWGLKHKLINEKKHEHFAGNAMHKQVAEPCEQKSSEVDGPEERVSSGKLIRNTSFVRPRNSFQMMGSNEDMMSVGESEEYAKKGREDFLLERNKSGNYSPSNLDNGLLRFYLTPFRSYRSKSGKRAG